MFNLDASYAMDGKTERASMGTNDGTENSRARKAK